VSQENVEIVRRAFQAFNSGGVEAALPFFRPDVVWYPTNQWLEDPAYHRHEGMRELSAAFAGNFDDVGYEVRELHDADDRVLACVEMTARIKNSGQPISQPLGLVVSDFHDGAFGEIRAFPSWLDARKAAGLAE
jgi:ketosteroid isomerase-like protein